MKENIDWTPAVFIDDNEGTFSLQDYVKPDPLPNEDKLYKWGSCPNLSERHIREIEKHPNFYKGHNLTEKEKKCVLESEKLRYECIGKKEEEKFLEKGVIETKFDWDKCWKAIDKIYPDVSRLNQDNIIEKIKKKLKVKLELKWNGNYLYIQGQPTSITYNQSLKAVQALAPMVGVSKAHSIVAKIIYDKIAQLF